MSSTNGVAKTDATGNGKFQTPAPSVRNRNSSGRRYRAYRETVKALDKQSRGNNASDEQLAETAKKADAKTGVRVSRRRSAKRSRGAMKLLKEFWRLLGGQKNRVIASMVVAGVTTGLALLPLYATKIVIDYVLINEQSIAGRPAWLTSVLATFGLASDSRLGLLWLVVLASVGIALVNLLLGLWSRWQATVASKRVSVQARKMAFDHAVRLPLHRVYDIKSGGVASVLRDDAGGTGELVFSLLYNPLKAIIQLAGSLLVLAYIRWELLLGALAILPVVYLTHRTWISRIRPIFRDIRNTRTQTDSHATEAFGGMRVVRTFNRQRGEAATFTENNHLMARQELFAWWWMRGIDAAWQVIIPVSVAGLLLFGGILGMKLGSDGKPMLSPGDLTAFLAYLLGLLQPIAMLANSATAFQNNLAGLDRTLDLLEEPQEFEKTPGQVGLDRADVDGHIRLENVHYAYPKQSGDLGESAVERGMEVLHGVDLDVPAGTTVAFVGPSGAGKTTLVQPHRKVLRPDRRARDARWHGHCATSTSTTTAAFWASWSRTPSCSTARSLKTSPTAAAPRPAPTSNAPPARPTPTSSSRTSPRATTPSSASAALSSAAGSASG